jgi:GntR family transcriptional regulator / MocR family aminotransferase
VDIHVSLVGRKNVTREIYAQLRAAILKGRLHPGDALTPTRLMAQRLSVSRTTVMEAYQRLSSEGFVFSRRGAGTFVSILAPRTHPELPRRGTPGAGREETGVDRALTARPVWDLVPLSIAFANDAPFDFRSGVPDASIFPYTKWRRLVARAAGSRPGSPSVYAHPAGHSGLREAIAQHVAVSRAVVCTAAEVTVTSGTQQALDLIGRVLLAPGDRVAVEDPGYMPAQLLFRSLGARVTGVPVDEDGIVVDALPRGARAVYVTPSHQYPTGAAMSLARRQALLEWAHRHQAAIIEDDYDSEFRFGGRPIESIQSLDRRGRVLYIGSFSKTMLPSLRLGFVVAPASLVDAVHRAKYVTDWHTSLPLQAALARFIETADSHATCEKRTRCTSRAARSF